MKYVIVVQPEADDMVPCCAIGQHEGNTHHEALASCPDWEGDEFSPTSKDWTQVGVEGGKIEKWDMGDRYLALIVRVD